VIKILPKDLRVKLSPEAYAQLRFSEYSTETAGIARIADRCKISKSITNSFAAIPETTQKET